MMSIITKIVKQYFIVVKTEDNKNVTLLVSKSNYTKDDNWLINYVKKYTNITPVSIEERFTKDQAYWMDLEDFVSNAHKGVLKVKGDGRHYILPIREERKPNKPTIRIYGKEK